LFLFCFCFVLFCFPFLVSIFSAALIPSSSSLVFDDKVDIQRGGRILLSTLCLHLTFRRKKAAFGETMALEGTVEEKASLGGFSTFFLSSSSFDYGITHFFKFEVYAHSSCINWIAATLTYMPRGVTDPLSSSSHVISTRGLPLLRLTSAAWAALCAMFATKTTGAPQVCPTTQCPSSSRTPFPLAPYGGVVVWLLLLLFQVLNVVLLRLLPSSL
jgi:hypothetical protein